MNKRAIFAALLIVMTAAPLISYPLTCKEQIYGLIHNHLYPDYDTVAENIVYLEQALIAEFTNPLYALARINNTTEWEYYKKLFMMHLNLKMVEQYRILASLYDKRVAYFYNYPWREANLKSLELAEIAYRNAVYYWGEAKKWSDEAAKTSWLFLENIDFWQDQSFRIQEGDLDYGAYLKMDMDRLTQVRREFEEMDGSELFAPNPELP